MKHRVDYRKLSRTTSHRKAMLDNMATSLFRHERIQTTLPKAKELKRFAEKLITRAKKDSTHSRRLVFRSIRDKEIVKKLFNTLAPRFAERNGGYIRILKLDYRMADSAPTAVVELIGSENIKTKKDKKQAEGVKEKGSKKEKKEAETKTLEKGKKESTAVKTGAEKVKDEAGEQIPASEVPFKKGKAREGAREAFMDKTKDEKVEKKRRLFDLWRKKAKEPEEEKKSLKKNEEISDLKTGKSSGSTTENTVEKKEENK